MEEYKLLFVPDLPMTDLDFPTTPAAHIHSTSTGHLRLHVENANGTRVESHGQEMPLWMKNQYLLKVMMQGRWLKRLMILRDAAFRNVLVVNLYIHIKNLKYHYDYTYIKIYDVINQYKYHSLARLHSSLHSRLQPLVPTCPASSGT